MSETFTLGDLFQPLSPRRRLLEDAIGEAIRILPVADATTVVAPRQSFVGVDLYPKQLAIIEDPARFTITEASTKAGKTMAHIEWMLGSGSRRGYGNSWWVAPVSGQADIGFRRCMQRLRGFIDSGDGPVRVSPPTQFERNMTERWIECFGVRFWFKSADKPDSLYGDDVYDLVGDEITRWKEDAWNACYTTLVATNGRGKLIGNVKGRHNFAYRLARKAQAGESDWSYHKLTAFDAIQGGVIDAETVEQARRDMPENVFRELFLAEASEDSGNPFGFSHIAACVTPLSHAAPICWGWDLAKSVDWTVGIGLDAEGRVCRFERFQKPWGETKATILQFTTCHAFVDSTGVGDPILEDLQRSKPGIFDGWKFTGPSKQKLIEGLAAGVQQKKIGFPDGAIRHEMDSFEYAYSRSGVHYSAPQGMHDDCVCALALAWAKWAAPPMEITPVNFRMW